MVALAHRMAEASGEVIRDYFRAPLEIVTKDDASPVTAADREAEAAIRKIIEGAHPDHGIIGEEFGAARADAEFVWVLDPIDGTRSFIVGKPLFGTLIALLHDRAPILGIIDQPVTGERWVGVAGRPTTLNGAPVRTRACPDLSAAALFTSGPERFEGAEVAAFERLRDAVGMTQYSADCYATALLATGCVDLVIESGLKVYDYVALVPVVLGAGGRITEWGLAARCWPGQRITAPCSPPATRTRTRRRRHYLRTHKATAPLGFEL